MKKVKLILKIIATIVLSCLILVFALSPFFVPAEEPIIFVFGCGVLIAVCLYPICLMWDKFADFIGF